MTKFYVVSGNLEVIIQAHNPRLAALEAFVRFAKQGTSLEERIAVDERGFRCYPKAKHYFDTDEILIEAGAEFEDDCE